MLSKIGLTSFQKETLWHPTCFNTLGKPRWMNKEQQGRHRSHRHHLRVGTAIGALGANSGSDSLRNEENRAQAADRAAKRGMIPTDLKDYFNLVV
jgi:hypothetical protein